MMGHGRSSSGPTIVEGGTNAPSAVLVECVCVWGGGNKATLPFAEANFWPEVWPSCPSLLSYSSEKGTWNGLGVAQEPGQGSRICWTLPQDAPQLGLQLGRSTRWHLFCGYRWACIFCKCNIQGFENLQMPKPPLDTPNPAGALLCSVLQGSGGPQNSTGFEYPLNSASTGVLGNGTVTDNGDLLYRVSRSWMWGTLRNCTDYSASEVLPEHCQVQPCSSSCGFPVCIKGLFCLKPGFMTASEDVFIHYNFVACLSFKVLWGAYRGSSRFLFSQSFCVVCWTDKEFVLYPDSPCCPLRWVFGIDIVATSVAKIRCGFDASNAHSPLLTFQAHVSSCRVPLALRISGLGSLTCGIIPSSPIFKKEQRMGSRYINSRWHLVVWLFVFILFVCNLLKSKLLRGSVQ